MNLLKGKLIVGTRCGRGWGNFIFKKLFQRWSGLNLWNNEGKLFFEMNHIKYWFIFEGMGNLWSNMLWEGGRIKWIFFYGIGLKGIKMKVLARMSRLAVYFKQGSGAEDSVGTHSNRPVLLWPTMKIWIVCFHF